VTRETYETRVLRGADFLDEHHPGWEKNIDLETFCLTDPCNCVVGQVEGDYYVGLKNFGLSPLLGPDSIIVYHHDEAHDLGFFENSLLEDDCDPHRDRRWDDLHETWVSLIRARRAQVTA